MSQVEIPWAAWYGDQPMILDFPEAWEVEVCRMKGGEDIGEEGIRRALSEPIGTPPLREFARGRSSAAILIDDLSRPTPAYRLLPYVLEELAAAGIPEERIKIIFALAAHRPLTRDDMIKKVGLEIVERMQLINHNAYENLEFLGYSSRGIPVFVNRDLTSCELRIAMGMITPADDSAQPSAYPREFSRPPFGGGAHGRLGLYRQPSTQRRFGDYGPGGRGYGCRL